MLYVGLDLSFNSTGVVIADTERQCFCLKRLTPEDCAVAQKIVNKFEHMHVRSMQIVNALLKLLLPYRHLPMQICIEEVAFGYGFRPGQTNSTYNLLFEGATVAAMLKHILGCDVKFISPVQHKKAFTGRGNAKKDLSIACMLDAWPSLALATDKLDDVADALSVLSAFIDIKSYAFRPDFEQQ